MRKEKRRFIELPQDTEMHSKKKVSPAESFVSIYNAEELLYQGRWNEIPLSEEKILSYSIQFFHDPAPCFIHRSAVRARMLAELEELKEELSASTEETEWYMSLAGYMGAKRITNVIFF